MTEEDVLRLIRTVPETEIKTAKVGLLYDRASCLTFPRAYDLVLNPELWEEKERAHVKTSRWCSGLIERFQSMTAGEGPVDRV